MYANKNYLILDVETTNLDKGDPLNADNRLVLACWRFRGRNYSCRGSEFEQHLLLGHIGECSYIVAHNAKFELGWLVRCGYDVESKPVYCTMLAEYVIAGNRNRALNLNACCERYKLGAKESLVDKLIKRKVCPSEIPPKWLLKYCRIDVALCHKLFLITRSILLKTDLIPVFTSRCMVTPVLADIERNGMHLDAERVNKKFEEISDEFRNVSIDMERFTGGINVNSNKQLIEFLFTTLAFKIPKINGVECTTPKGDPQVTTEALSALKSTTKRQREFLTLQRRYNGLNSLLTKYLAKLQECCENDGGVLLGQYNQAISRTHRLTSSGKKYRIQLQNLPREFKPLFTARKEGWLVMEVDESQLEFRIAGDLSDDCQVEKDVRDGYDVHAATASILYNEFEGATGSARKALRTRAKASTFRPLFGGSRGTKKERAYFESFKVRYAGVASTQQGWVDEVVRTGGLTLQTGLKVYWPGTKIEHSGYVTNTTQIFNLPIQNFASAEVVLLALVIIWKELRSRGLRSFIINTIHDSVILEVHPDEVEEVGALCAKALTSDVVDLIEELYDYRIKIPLEAEVDVSKHWSEV